MYTHNKSFRRMLGGPPAQLWDRGWGVGSNDDGDPRSWGWMPSGQGSYWKSADKGERNLQSYERKKIIPIIYEEVYNKWMS